MITNIGLKNFKCFGNLDLQIAPFTLLAGLNGMGKSSLIQAVLLLKQSFISGDIYSGRLQVGGELTDLGTGVDILFENAEEDQICFSMTFSEGAPAGPHQLTFLYDRESDQLSADKTKSDDFQSSLKIFAEHLIIRPLVYIHAERWGPRKSLPLSESRVRARDLGPRGEYVLHYLLEHGGQVITEDDARFKKNANGERFIDQVETWLQEISPGSHLSVEAVRAADLVISGFSFDRDGDIPSRRFRATNVGFGLSYSLPVISALLGTAPGGLVLIENPEAHLHPRGQTRLGQLAARAAAAGVQVIAETHSDHFMDGVRIDIRDGLLKSDSAAFHYFRREGARSVVDSPLIDPDGRLSLWPEGFFDQHDENLVRLLAPKSQNDA